MTSVSIDFKLLVDKKAVIFLSVKFKLFGLSWFHS